ncbi:MAG: hypothetical protein LBC82_01370 [Oscillospiraceae bacterium]|jgi:hypothetical protein|nr:hypothetical protein [Oscillospiraceae bacterium]
MSEIINRTGQPWAEHEDAVLIKGYKNGKPVLLIAETLNRSPGSVRGRASLLNLKKGQAADDYEPSLEIATCSHCGQANLSDPLDCNCPEARREARIQAQIDKARERIKQLFGENAAERGFAPIHSTDTLDLMNDVVTLIANHAIKNATLQITGRCKAKISLTAKGSIKVGRTETTTYQL